MSLNRVLSVAHFYLSSEVSIPQLHATETKPFTIHRFAFCRYPRDQLSKIPIVRTEVRIINVTPVSRIRDIKAGDVSAQLLFLDVTSILAVELIATLLSFSHWIFPLLTDRKAYSSSWYGFSSVRGPPHVTVPYVYMYSLQHVCTQIYPISSATCSHPFDTRFCSGPWLCASTRVNLTRHPDVLIHIVIISKCILTMQNLEASIDRFVPSNCICILCPVSGDNYPKLCHFLIH